MPGSFAYGVIFKGKDETKGAVASVKRGINGVSGTVAKLTGLLAAGGFLVAGKQAIDAADKIGKLSERLGASTEALSEYAHVAELSGIAQNTMTTGLQRMTRRIAEVATTSKGVAAPALEALGLNAQKLAELPLDAQFENIAEQMNKMTDSGEKVRLAMQLFDTEGVSLIQTMGKGAAGIQEMREEARRLGKSLSQDQTKAAADFNNAITKLKGSFGGIVQSITVAVLPALTKLLNYFGTLLPPAINFIKDLFGALRLAMINMAMSFLESLQAIEQAFFDMQKSISDTVNKSDRWFNELAGGILDVADTTEEAAKTSVRFAGALETLREMARDTTKALTGSSSGSGGSEGGVAGGVNLIGLEMLDAKKIAVDYNKEIAKTAEVLLATQKVAVDHEGEVNRLAQSMLDGFKKANDGIADSFVQLSRQISGSLGDIVANAQNAFNSVQNAISKPGFFSIAGAVTSVIDFFGDLFGGGGSPRSNIFFGDFGAGNFHRGRKPNDMGFDFAGLPVTIGAGVNDFSESQGQVTQAFQQFFGFVESILNPAQLAQFQGQLRGRQIEIDPESIQQTIDMLTRTLIGSLDPFRRGLVGATGATGSEDQLAALQVVTGMLSALDVDAVQMFNDAISGPQSVTESALDLASTLMNLTATTDGSITSFQDIERTTRQLSQTVVEALTAIDAASKSIAQTTDSTIFGLEFNATQGPRNQFQFIREEIQRLTRLIPTLSDPQQIAATVARINQLTSQAQGLAGTFFGDDVEGFREFTERQVDFLRDVQEMADRRLETLAQEVTDAYQEAMARAREDLQAVASEFQTGVDAFNAGSGRWAGQFGGYVGQFGQYVNAGITIDFDTAVTAPNPNG